MIGQSEMDQYAKMEERLLNGYYSIGEIVEPASQDAFWQEYGAPSIMDGGLGYIALGQSNQPSKLGAILGVAAIGAIGYAAYKYLKR